jgi:three-Cys-motif partner protein
MDKNRINMNKFNPIIEVENDGLYTPEVRSWSLEKYKLVGSYCDIFTNGMKDKWNQLVYIDLFAGAGYSTIIETGKSYLSSALIAMSVPNKFSSYILCEQDENRFKSLKQRILNNFSHLNVTLIKGDSNGISENVRTAIPRFYKGNTMLSFCFVDPFSLDLNFNTIETLGKNINMDFLILQALHMDANRNLGKYLKEENERIAQYLGNSDWRNDFNKNCNEYGTNFVRFLAEQYILKMQSMNYIPEKNMLQIRSNEKNLPLYYLAFYSKHPRGIEYYKKVEKYANSQLKMDF